MKKLIALGKEFGFEGKELLAFVKERQDEEKRRVDKEGEERQRERESKKLEAEETNVHGYENWKKRKRNKWEKEKKKLRENIELQSATKHFGQNSKRAGLDSSKNNLIKSGLDFWSTKDAIDELKRLIPLAAKKYLGKYGEGQKFTVVKAFPMLSRIAQRWYKTFMRRMIAKCGVRNPWRVTFSEYLSIDLFNIMQQIIARSSYGVICMSTKKNALRLLSLTMPGLGMFFAS
ncbi:Hypothetical predicted protein [Paramuricea clavata]|uniref:Uncharacterized protein n=1 Tax=Paramuricea clavata TaxID=317549 RepID=A0A7D9JA22_PARCT|nr:Hypothetical predicted protein [Paramuricea clavata]